jgi:pyrroloquinoline quinone (PQQ) biosynthesis protein C
MGRQNPAHVLVITSMRSREGDAVTSSLGKDTAAKVIAIREQWHTKNHPFFLDFAAGKFGLGPIGAMMAQHHQHVRRVLPSLGVAFYRAPEGAGRRFLLENLAEEEGLLAGPGEGRNAVEHMELIFRFCRFAGLTDDQVKRTRQLTTWRARSYFYINTVREEPFSVIVAMMSTQEGQQPALNGERMLPAFKLHHGLEMDHPNIEFFAEHYLADADHSSRLIDLVATLVQSDAEAARAVEVAETAVRTRWDCMTELYRVTVLGQTDPLPAGVAA